MKKILLVLSLFISSCGYSPFREAWDDIKGDATETSSEVPKDKNSSYDNIWLLNKGLVYINQSYRATSRHYDQYGLLLPTKPTGMGGFKDQGDALLFNSFALANMCQIQQLVNEKKLSKDFDLSNEIQSLGNNYQNYLQTKDGALIRHPDFIANKSYTSVSKDGIAGFLYLGSKVFESNCSFKDQYKIMVINFLNFVKANNWEMSITKKDLSVTKLTDRHYLAMVLNLYDITADLDLGTSYHDLKSQTEYADYVNQNVSRCKELKYFTDNAFCQLFDGTAVSGNHLTYLGLQVAIVEAKYKKNSQYTLGLLKDYSLNMAKVGDSVGAYNWLFVSGYRRYYERTFNDIAEFLLNNFPENIPTETNGVLGWGCTDYIWQRTPFEKCNQDDTEYLGNDFLIVFVNIL